MSRLVSQFPVVAKFIGEWRGVYTHVDAAGQVLDRHDAHLKSVAPDDGPFIIHQVNTYTWADGRKEAIPFGGVAREGRIHFDNERIVGELWETDAQTLLLRWVYKGDPDTYLYELLQVSHDGNHRARTWHWMRGDRLVKRTLIVEDRIG